MFDSSENKSVNFNTEDFQHLVENLPVGAYICDADGLITYYNQAAASLWGRKPKLNDSGDRFCGSFKLLSPKGKIIIPDESWMALAIKQNKSFNNLEVIVEQPDGKQLTALINANPIHDIEGNVIGASNIVIDITDRKKVENTLSKTFEMPTTLLMIVDKEGIIIRVSQGWEKMLGYSIEEMQGTLFTEYLHPDDLAVTVDTAKNVQQGKLTKNFENRYRCKDSSYRMLSWSSSVDSETGIRYGCATDITERNQAENKLKRLSRIFEDTLNEIYLFDVETLNFVQVNDAALKNLGYTTNELKKLTPVDIKPEFTTESFLEMLSSIRNGENKKLVFETVHQRKDKSLYHVEIHLQLLQHDNDELYVAIVLDITDRKLTNELLIYQASHDSLTGLINRHEFERRAKHLISSISSSKEEHAFCFMDLDQFKVVNDTCGHPAGDELLRQITALLQTVVRKRDTLARLGGDEFGVLMEHCSLEDAHRVAASLQKAIQDYQFIWEGHTFKIGVSIGLVPITEITDSLTELLKDADAACYMAKDKGRNRIHVYHPDDIDIANRYGEMQWVERINRAIEDNRLCLYAQSIEPLDQKETNHYELLVRMIDDNNETIPPGAFLPAAERYNIISKIDHWVITQAFSELEAHPEFLEQINLCSINLSGHSLTDPGILEFIISQLDKFNIAGSKICFEITETAAISNLSNAMHFISSLKALGCRFALDDFGSGLSSFAYLKNLPVDYLKIDGMFVKDIVDDPIDHAMVKSINEIGHVMGMQTIAEFVENDVIKGMLKEIGVNYAQGYGVKKPQPFEDLLKASNKN